MDREASCPVCGRAISKRGGFVLVYGWRRHVHCSTACLEDNVRARRVWRRVAWRRFSAALSIAAVVAGATGALWRRFHAPRSQTIAVEWPELPDPEPLPKPVL